MILQNNEITCNFDEAGGRLLEVKKGSLSIAFDGLVFDFGCNEKNQTEILAYDSMLDFRTWNLPAVKPTKKMELPAPISCIKEDDHVTVSYQFPDAVISIIYELLNDSLVISSRIKNISNEPIYLNTFSFITRLKQIDDVTFDFPANVPFQYCKPAKLEPYQVVETGLVNFAVHTKIGTSDFNLLFIDLIEKWSNGVYQDGFCTNYVYSAALEADLLPNDTLDVGSLYLQLITEGNPYIKIREFVENLGFHPCEGGITDGVMYSCHPAGTMDSNFPLKQDLFAYADYLPVLKAMGIDHVWLLPVFDHNEDGVYHSNDQAVIDERYGGEEGCKYYCDKAHELGMTVLFDYVPHGPAPEFPLAKDNPEWPAKKRNGSLQDEWNCVSMDYNHPGYIEYTAELVHDHVRRFGIDGSRIDCAMGGLSNWRPYKGERPSGNSIRAGVHISEAVREGFLRGGKTSFILPENFYPLPNYYHTTDLFYGMNLIRVLYVIEPLLQSDPSEFVHILTDFLEREAMITPVNYHKLRFLGNHDTVSWVWQSKRAVSSYTEEGAKALWAVMSLIDGMPMIYQGDEDPAIYNGEGSNLIPFFTNLFSARRKYIPENSNETEYIYTDSPVMAFIRKGGEKRVLVAVNLSAEINRFDLSRYPEVGLLNAESSDAVEAGVMKPYSYHIYKI